MAHLDGFIIVLIIRLGLVMRETIGARKPSLRDGGLICGIDFYLQAKPHFGNTFMFEIYRDIL